MDTINGTHEGAAAYRGSPSLFLALAQIQKLQLHFDIRSAAVAELRCSRQETKPSPNQLAAFRELVDYLRSDVVGKKIRFAVHREIDPGRTVCPGRYFPTAKMHRRYGRFISPNTV